MSDPFTIMNCDLIGLATGERSHNIRELHGSLTRIQNSDIIYNHFWGGRLRPHFVDPEFLNDFASWVFHELHDLHLAEQLAMINPGDFDSIEDVRHAMIDLIEDRMDEDEVITRVMAVHPFFFTRSQIVVFDSGMRVNAPEAFTDVMPQLSSGSIFYHVIDAKRRVDSGLDDFSEWLAGLGNDYSPLIEIITAVDPFFNSLAELRQKFTDIFQNYFTTG